MLHFICYHCGTRLKINLSKKYVKNKSQTRRLCQYLSERKICCKHAFILYEYINLDHDRTIKLDEKEIHSVLIALSL